jgi:ABC-2 family transporter protein
MSAHIFRIWTLAMSTVTQLVRMKIVAFLVVFCLVVVAAAFAFPVMNPEQQLKLLKDVSFGALQLFAIIIAIVATALLLPRDVEDRTLYTILAKPVPRLNYLLGKLLGVLVVIGVGLVVMDAIFSIVLWFRQEMVLAEALAELQRDQRSTPDAVAGVTANVMQQGLTWNLHWGVWAVFLKASVLATLALLISSFASSTLFTIVCTFCFAILGHGQDLLRSYLFQGGLTFFERFLSSLLSIACPDLGLFDVVETIIAGHRILGSEALTMTGIAALYVAGYTFITYLIFMEKEL